MIFLLCIGGSEMSYGQTTVTLKGGTTQSKKNEDFTACFGTPNSVYCGFASGTKVFEIDNTPFGYCAHWFVNGVYVTDDCDNGFNPRFTYNITGNAIVEANMYDNSPWTYLHNHKWYIYTSNGANPTISNISTNSATLNWNSVNGAYSYDVEATGGIYPCLNTTNTSCNIAGLSCGAGQYATVQVNCVECVNNSLSNVYSSSWSGPGFWTKCYSPSGASANQNNVCPGDPVTLTVSGSACSACSWKWYSGGCGSNYVNQGSSITVSPTSSTTYYVRAEGSNSLTHTSCSTVTVNVKSNSVEPSSASATPSSICCGSTTQLSKNGGSLGTNASWKWYAGGCGNNLVGTGAQITVSPTTTTTYYVRAEGDCGPTNCKFTTVNVTSQPSQPIITGPNPVCEGSSNIIYSTSPTCAQTYLWTVSGGTIGSGQGSSSIGVNVVSSGSMTVSVEAKNTTCSSQNSNSKTVTVNPIPVVSVPVNGNANVTSCSQETYYVSASYATGYLWTFSPWTYVSGQGTSSLTVTVGNTPANICVDVSNSCGSAPLSCKNNILVNTCSPTVSTQNMNVTSDAGSEWFTITANGYWSIDTSSMGCPWITSISQLSGFGSATVYVYYNANTTCSPRTCQFTINCCTESLTMTINQSQPTYQLFITSNGCTGPVVEVNNIPETTPYQGNFGCNTSVNLYTQPVSPDGCCTFTGWSGAINSSSNPVSVLMDAQKSITAIYTTNQAVISTSVNPPGSGTSTGDNTYICGDSVYLSASPVTCYEFQYWTEGTDTVSYIANYGSIADTNNKTFVAHFDSADYDINLSVTPANSGVVTGGGNYECGVTVTIEATANDSTWCFLNWTEDNVVVSQNSTFQFPSLIDKNYVANFGSEIPSVEFTSPLNGSFISSNITFIDVGGTGTPDGCGDSISQVEVKFDTLDWKIATGTNIWQHSLSIQVEGGVAYPIYVRARDIGNDYSSTDMITINVIPTSVLENSLDNKIMIYPNPANEKLYLKVLDENINSQNSSVKITDIQGRVVFEKPVDIISKYPVIMDISEYSPGLYFVRVRIGEEDPFYSNFTKMGK